MDSNIEYRQVEVPVSSDVMHQQVDIKRHRFPHSIVWTPIPMITWFFPFIGHLGICYTNGVIRDFAGSYYVSEDCMGFGWPTRYWQLDIGRVPMGAQAWDRAVHEASEEYKQHAHNLFCDNCHSHVALALNTMQYDGRSNYGMVYLAAMLFFRGKYTGISGALMTWLPFLLVVGIVIVVATLPSALN